MFRKYDDDFEEQDMPDYETLMKEYKRDKKYVDFSVPKEWDAEFQRMIWDAQKEGRRQTVKRMLVAVVCMLFVVGISGGVWCQNVQGMNVVELFSRLFTEQNYTHPIYGTNEKFTTKTLDELEDAEILFEKETLNSIFDEIRGIRKQPLFYCEDIFCDYQIVLAQYNQDFEFLSLKIQTKKGNIYINQDFMYKNKGSGSCFENEPVSIVYNEQLNVNISIYESIQDNICERYIFEVQFENYLFFFDGAVTLNECEKIAKSLLYK